MEKKDGGGISPSFEKNKEIPDIYHQSYRWFRKGAGWILREEWYLVNPKSKSLQQKLLAFRETFFENRIAD